MTPDQRRPGPLAGLRVVELAGLGPAPFCAMVLADLGADVVRLERAGQAPPAPGAPDRRLVLTRGRPAVGVDLKRPEGVDVVLSVAERADVLVEGFRPGVMERLGLGPDECMARNPRLVYGRVTGYGRQGPLAAEPGHDINYLALSGMLAPIGRRDEAPVPPLNLVADFGGGGLLLAMGVLAAIVERSRSGRGQVVDTAMVDGAALLGTMVYEMWGLGHWNAARGTNSVDGGAPYYNVYATADGRYLAAGAMEPEFYRAFMRGLGFADAEIPVQADTGRWAETSARVAEIVAKRSLADWLAVFKGTDACVTPVLSLAEAPNHPRNRAQGSFVEVGGIVSPAPAPRFERTPPAAPQPRSEATHEPEALLAWGLGQAELIELVAAGVVD